ncbi:MAG TPA: hypothetical protein VMG58_11300 [Candidatus Sulfotelmatobacter sp.]|nr:hypothetical protein [Candidatus Sulfotelmatobacter sp.]HUJ18436.1 hypothetical protein [Nitrospirota bacterium]
MPVRAKELIRTITLRKQIEASRGLQIAVAFAGIISALMVLGTIFEAPVLIYGQYRAIETRGRERGLFLGRAGTDPITGKDMVALDALVAEAVTREIDKFKV